MKRFRRHLIWLFGAVLVNTHAADLETDKEKLSYSLGIFFGQTVSRQDMELDIPAFLQAVEDSLSGAETRLSGAEMQQILSDYQRQEQQQRAAQANRNRQDGARYLEENKQKAGFKTLPSGLQYKIIKAGAGPRPGAESLVLVHYRGSLIDGTEFDSSYARGEPVTLGVDQVIKGWQEALQMMPAGSSWQIVVPSDLAYGERGAGGVIGPDATLLFDIELLEIK